MYSSSSSFALRLCVIFSVNLITLIPDYVNSYLGWKFNCKRNSTLYGLTFMGNRKTVGGVAYVLNSFLGMTSFVGVILFTAVLVTKLGQASKWRKKTTLGYHQHQSMSTRDQKTVKMIVLIATILIVCYSPSALISTAAFIIGNEFDRLGKYVNVFLNVLKLLNGKYGF